MISPIIIGKVTRFIKMSETIGRKAVTWLLASLSALRPAGALQLLQLIAKAFDY